MTKCKVTQSGSVENLSGSQDLVDTDPNTTTALTITLTISHQEQNIVMQVPLHSSATIPLWKGPLKLSTIFQSKTQKREISLLCSRADLCPVCKMDDYSALDLEMLNVS